MNRTLRKTFAILIFISITLACQNENQGKLANYYMPAKAENGGIVHKFQDLGVRQTTEYWYYNFQSEADTPRLIVTVYDQNLNQQQLSVERPLSNGWVQEKLLLFSPDSTGVQSASATIKTANRFAFDVKDSLDVIHYSIEWKENLDGEEAKKRLFRNSRFMGFDTVEVFNQKHRAAHFISHDKVEDEREGTLTVDLETEEYYVENLGLVEKKQYYTQGKQKRLVRHLKLSDTLSMADLENILKERQE